ncbi:MAG: M13 family metallopeptidase [Myxococcales bacterium]|nr:M13 family metallopeptidase [Myxococcales bacterium]
MKRSGPLAVSLILIATACNSKKPSEGKAPPVATGSGSAGSASAGSGAAPAPAAPAGLDLAGMNRGVKPGDDFFRYANGTWFDRTEIPADRASWGAGAIASELTATRVADLIKEAQSAAEGSEARKVGDYYAAYMDDAAIENKGLAPLEPRLAAIDGIADHKGLCRAIGETLRADVDAINNTNYETPNLFGVWIAQDFVDPAKYSVFLLQGGISLPNKEYYVDASEKMAEMRAKLRAHIEKVLTLAKRPDPAGAAQRILELETKLAQAHASRTESHHVKNGTLHWSRAQLQQNAPGIDWTALLDGAQLGSITELVPWHAKATSQISGLVKNQPLATWKEYLAYRLLDHASPLLPKAFADEAFAFYGTTLAGTPTQRDRWKRAVDATSDAMGQAVGKLYVGTYFPEASKQKVAALVKNLMTAFDKRIDALAWMAPATKAKARAKLAVLKIGVGYPDTWRDYAGLEVVKGDALGNAHRAAMFEYKRNLAKLGKPVDRDEWVMNPQLVNAVNLPAMNAMNFPAAILQPPYFDPDRPTAMDYGAIGAVIGHEISHSFDDQGAQFDETGRLKNWWTPEDAKHFAAAGKALAVQYDAYKPLPDLAVNGTLTLSENIADVAGLAAAYDAFKASLNGAEAPAWNGLTGDQQFFVSFAQAWRTKMREPALRRRILTDGHAPGEYRADTVRNLDAWYQAFDVKAGEALFLAPEARVRVW